MRYSDAIRQGFERSLNDDPRMLVIGQGLWSPWYVGETMRDLEKTFGKHRIIDTPVSEQASTGAAIGAALCGYPCVVTHPRVDFSLLAMDQMINQAAKWSSMFGGGIALPVVFRLIVNRGGEQGAQHSQSLYSWFAHIPGLRVLLPAVPQDAQDMLVTAVRSPDPVVYIDDRWLYDVEGEVEPTPTAMDVSGIGPRLVRSGKDLTLVGASFGTKLALDAAEILRESYDIDCDVVDLRCVNPLDLSLVFTRVEHTGRLLVVEMDWSSCGIAAEVIAACSEVMSIGSWRGTPQRVNLLNAPAPTSRTLEDIYYPGVQDVVRATLDLVKTE